MTGPGAERAAGAGETAGAGGLAQLQAQVAACARCPRLRAHGAATAARGKPAFAGQAYWARPVPSFGDPGARLLLVGLAPAAHGANRTGRMFTGDRSGDFLFAALHRAGFASQAASRDAGDGLALRDCYITAAARCAPPDNRPTPGEFALCRPYLERELDLLPHWEAVVALGRLAHEQLLAALLEKGWIAARAGYAFRHGAAFPLPGGRRLLACYHPSQQNTFTGRLTPAMLDAVFAEARQAFRPPAPAIR